MSWEVASEKDLLENKVGFTHASTHAHTHNIIGCIVNIIFHVKRQEDVSDCKGQKLEITRKMGERNEEVDEKKAEGQSEGMMDEG